MVSAPGETAGRCTRRQQEQLAEMLQVVVGKAHQQRHQRQDQRAGDNFLLFTTWPCRRASRSFFAVGCSGLLGALGVLQARRSRQAQRSTASSRAS